MVSDSVSFTLTHGGFQGWERRWRQVRQGYRKLSDIYDGTTTLGGTAEWEALAVAFFVGCHHMGDWFKNDSRLPEAVRQDALPYRHADPDLRLAAAISNTSKHLTRDDPNAMTAYILEVSGRPHGGSMTVAWDVQGQRLGTRDARDLANACVTSWRAFLQRHRLAEHAPPS